MKAKAIAIPFSSKELTKTLNRVITSIVFVLAVASIHTIVKHDRPSPVPFGTASVSTQVFTSSR